jgi:iron-sulfur cluster assembly protein
MISLTAAAVLQILASAQQSDAEDLALRVAARRAPDGSLEYGLGFDETREGDLAIEQDGVRLLIGVPSQSLLEGTTIDFVEYETGEPRFLFVPADPATGAEGCGCAARDRGSCGAKG